MPVIDIDILLLVLKLVIVALLYVFIWRVVRTAVSNVRSAAAVSPAPDIALPAAGAVPAVERPRQSMSPPPGGGRAPRPRLIVERSPGLTVGTEFPLGERLTIGRHADNDIVLDEKVVSSAHARIQRQAGMLVVEDLGSTNGTFVDERRVTQAPLDPESTVRIGETVFRFER